MSRWKVYIVGGDGGVHRMFQKRTEWDIVDSLKYADLVQFTGGADISPELYKHTLHPKTYTNPVRDKKECIVFELAASMGKPMAGICRGGQLLNVMCGGSMWQHVNNHTASHPVRDLITGEIFNTSSTHHQMMIRAKGSVLIGVADTCTHKELHVNNKVQVKDGKSMPDVEILAYPKQKVFCFQGHPEYGISDLENRYFEYLHEWCLPKQEEKTNA